MSNRLKLTAGLPRQMTSASLDVSLLSSSSRIISSCAAWTGRLSARSCKLGNPASSVVLRARGTCTSPLTAVAPRLLLLWPMTAFGPGAASPFRLGLFETCSSNCVVIGVSALHIPLVSCIRCCGRLIDCSPSRVSFFCTPVAGRALLLALRLLVLDFWQTTSCRQRCSRHAEPLHTQETLHVPSTFVWLELDRSHVAQRQSVPRRYLHASDSLRRSDSRLCLSPSKRLSHEWCHLPVLLSNSVRASTAERCQSIVAAAC